MGIMIMYFEGMAEGGRTAKAIGYNRYNTKK
jgi:hypothetical protein